MKMYVYLGYRRTRYGGQRPALCIETNLPWALAYWTKRKTVQDELNWEIR